MSVLVLTYWSFHEGLIQTYTLPYLRQISDVIDTDSQIYLVTLKKPSSTGNSHELEIMIDDLKRQRINLIEFPYRRFGFLAALTWLFMIFYLIGLTFFKNIRSIHAFCTPAAMIGSILSFITRRDLIVDSYEPHAESSIENGDWSRSSLKFKLLFWFEKYLSRKAKVVVSATEGMRQYAKEKYNVTFENFHVKPACVDLGKFHKKTLNDPYLIEKLGLEGKLVAVYAGKFGGIYLDQEVFDFFKVAKNFWGAKFRVLLLTSHTESQIQDWAEASGLSLDMFIVKYVLHSDVPKYLGLGDFAITPVKSIPSKRYCTPIKNGEYWALGLPVVITKNISDDSDIIQKYNIGYVLQNLDSDEYKNAVLKIDELLTVESKYSLYTRIRAVAENYRSFRISKRIYSNIYG